jgi:hypothetical protein
LIQSIYSEKARLQQLFGQLKEQANNAPLELQHVYSNHVALKTGGFLENSTKAIFKEYCSRNSNPEISNYVQHQIARLNSLSCEKIAKLMQAFLHDAKWEEIAKLCETADLEAVDSVKAIRDQVAHGKSNGSGITLTINYYERVTHFVECMEITLVPE